MRVLVTGAGGLLGRALVPRLQRAGHAVTRLARAAGGAVAPAGVAALRWDPESEPAPRAALAQAAFEAVVHLAGEPVGVRWTKAVRRRIAASRVDATRALAETLATLDPRPRALVSASAVGYYGSRGEQVLDETAAPGEGFLAKVTAGWERATDPARDAGIRVVNARFGIVLSPRGGVLARLLPMFRAGVGGPIGAGRAWWSWIALDDAVMVLARAIQDERMAGPFNVTSPAPVRNAEFARTLGRALHRPALLPVPAWALALVYGDMARESLLASQRAVPQRLHELGIGLGAPELARALRAMLAG